MIQWIGKNRHIYAGGFQVPFADTLPSRRWSITIHSVSVGAHSDFPPENKYSVETGKVTLQWRTWQTPSQVIKANMNSGLSCWKHAPFMWCGESGTFLLWPFSQKCYPSPIIRELEKHRLQNLLLKDRKVIESEGSLRNCHSFILN